MVKSLTYFTLSLLLFPLVTFAEMPSGPPQPSKFQSQSRQFNQEPNIVTVNGKVVEVLKMRRSPDDKMYGVHLIVKSDKGDVNVHLGPSWYLDKIGLKINTGDDVVVEGALIGMADKSAIIANSVQVNDKTFALRGDRGFPLWRQRGEMNR